MSFYIKLFIILLICGGLFAGYKYYIYDNTVINKQKIVELEQKNKDLEDKIQAALKNSEDLKLSINSIELEKSELRTKINTNKSNLKNIQSRILDNEKRYAETINNISADSSDIYNRCLRMCESAKSLDRKFSCAVDFCNQFSTNNSARPTAK